MSHMGSFEFLKFSCVRVSHVSQEAASENDKNGQKPNSVSRGYGQGVGRTGSFWRLQGTPASSLFQMLEATCLLWPVALSSTSKLPLPPGHSSFASPRLPL